jgi:hypothetical protein
MILHYCLSLITEENEIMKVKEEKEINNRMYIRKNVRDLRSGEGIFIPEVLK